MKKPIFEGSGVAIVTPMKKDGSINFDKLSELIEFQLAGGTDAIISCGTTGESATMTCQEHVDVIKHTVKCVNKRVPVIAGAGSNETTVAAELACEAKQCGADALLVVTPYYNKTSQSGLVAHFNYIADQAEMPMILYNVPSRTGLNIKPETYAELAKNKYIVAAKEACADISAIARVAQLCGDELVIYSGNDDQTVPIMSLGGKGVISVMANITPRPMHDICSLYLSGKTEQSTELFLEYLKLMNDLFIDVNPIPVKEAMNMMGMEVGECRLPLVKMSENERIKLCKTLEEYSLVGKA